MQHLNICTSVIKRLVACALCFCMVVGLFPGYVFAAEVDETTETQAATEPQATTETQAATEPQATTETQAATEPQVTTDSTETPVTDPTETPTTDPVETSETDPTGEPETKTDPTENPSADPDGDLTEEPAENPTQEPTAAPSEEATEPEVILVSDWAWVDEMEVLEDGELCLPGASAENPAYFSDIVELLPQTVLADGLSLPLTWSCPGFPEDGAYEGSYLFTAALPEGCALAEGAAPLKVTVVLGGVSLFDETVETFTVTDKITLQGTITNAEAVYLIVGLNGNMIVEPTKYNGGSVPAYTNSISEYYVNVFVKGSNSLVTGLGTSEGDWKQIYSIDKLQGPAAKTPKDILADLKEQGYVAGFGWTRNSTSNDEIIKFNITGQTPQPSIIASTNAENVKPGEEIDIAVTITPGDLFVKYEAELNSATVYINGDAFELANPTANADGSYSGTIRYTVTENDDKIGYVTAQASCNFTYSYSLQAGSVGAQITTEATISADSPVIVISLAAKGAVRYSFTGDVPVGVPVPEDSKTYYEDEEVKVIQTPAKGKTIERDNYIYTFNGWTYNGTPVIDSVAMPSTGGITFLGNWTKAPDLTKTQDTIYSVRYTIEGEEQTDAGLEVKSTAWINENPAQIVIAEGGIPADPQMYTGYKLDPANPQYPAAGTKVNSGSEYTVNYIKDETWTKEIKYTVHYTIEGEEQIGDMLEVKAAVWVNDETTQIAIAEGGIPTPEDKYTGYMLDSENDDYPTEGTMVNRGSEYTVNYIKDDTQTQNTYYIVHYTINGVEQVDDVLEVKGTAWINDDPAQIAIAKGGIAPADKYIGYELDPENPEYPAENTMVDSGSEYTVNYVTGCYTVTYKYVGSVPAGASALPADVQYQYGDSVTIAAAATAPGYIFSGWSENGSFSMPAKNVEITGSFTAGTSKYKVEHYLEDLDGKAYSLKDTENLTGTTDSTVTAAAKTYKGFTFDGTVKGTVKQGKIAADGSLVLKLYYTRSTYTVTYNDGVRGWEVFKDQVFSSLPYGTKTPQFNGTPKRSGYIFKGWEPKVEAAVTGSVTYKAVWAREHHGWWDNPKTGDYIMIAVGVMAAAGIGLAGLAAYSISRKKKNKQSGK